MAYRKKLKRKASKRNFTKNALKVKKVNYKSPAPMRGGIRL
jgi:hypothetical protein